VVINHWVRDKELEKTFPDDDQNGWPAWQELRNGEDRRRIATRRIISNRRSGFDRRDYADSGKRKIYGLDVDQGLKRFNDDEDTYLDILKSYVQNTPSLLAQMHDFTKETLPDYAIVVHGIKGSSRTIGANTIGAEAEALELAAKAGDLAFVSAQNDAFLDTVQEMLARLSAMFKRIEEESAKPGKTEPDVNMLAELKKACEAFDIDETEKVMDELESYTYESGSELIEWLKSQVNVVGFKKIAERLEAEIDEKM
jgi:HPt (histidine-containing phosphotransfer) domain-containing protein